MNVDLSQLITAETKRETALAEARTTALSGLIAWIDVTTAAITGPVPGDEKLSWSSKEAAARALLAGTATEAERVLISCEAATFGEADAALCDLIVQNADAWRGIIATLAGIRRRVVAAILQAATPQEAEDALEPGRAEWDVVAGKT